MKTFIANHKLVRTIIVFIVDIFLPQKSWEITVLINSSIKIQLKPNESKSNPLLDNTRVKRKKKKNLLLAALSIIKKKSNF